MGLPANGGGYQTLELVARSDIQKRRTRAQEMVRAMVRVSAAESRRKNVHMPYIIRAVEGNGQITIGLVVNEYIRAEWRGDNRRTTGG